jgi:TRAP-type C4-dicarboxylate transport system permease small subunit
MNLRDRLVSQRQRHLKWPALDPLETVLMVLCGVLLFGFCTTVIFDIITREIRHPWLWLQEVTSTFFIYAIFTGTAVASRRNDHLYLTAVGDSLHGRARTVVEVATRIVVLVVALCFIYFGYLNFLRGFTSFRMPSMTPIASLYASIPLSGVLIALFMVEQLVNGWRNGFESDEEGDDPLLVRTIEPIPPVDVSGGTR